MKDKKFKDRIAYAAEFVSFVLPKVDVEEIILFGSVARNEAAEKSDIDLFFNVKTNEKGAKKIIKEELTKFHKSEMQERWALKGISNPINIEAGNLEKWKLKRSVISDGLVLYGKYKALPEKLKGYSHFTLKPIKDIAKRNKVMRILLGRKEKNYETSGLLEKTNGKKLSPTSFLIPIEKSHEAIEILGSEKIDFSFFELWSDQVGN